MTNTAHTAGPWRLSGPGYFSNYTIFPPEEPFAIATVTYGDLRELGGEIKEHTANARLIAAAPELLEALEEQTKEFVAFMERSGFSNETANAVVSVIKARAALSKARGETQEG